MTLLALEGVCRRFADVDAVRDVDLVVGQGERTVVVGPSGCGKTTLLRLIAGFVRPDRGRIAIEGRTVAEGAAMVAAHRRPVGLVSQDGSLFPHLSVEGNIAFGLDRRGPEARSRVRSLMEMVELDGSLARRRPHELSGGQQQRVALARALARRPRLMLLDEPFSALDVGLRANLRRTVVDLLGREGIAAVLVTHDRTEALSFGDQVAVMRDAAVVQVGRPRDLYLRPVDVATANLLGEALILPGSLRDRSATCALGSLPTAQDGAGAVHVMVRPEQLRLGRAGRSPCLEVTAVEFQGASSEVVLRDTAIGFDATNLRIRTAAHETPEVGDIVHLQVDGEVVVFFG